MARRLRSNIPQSSVFEGISTYVSLLDGRIEAHAHDSYELEILNKGQLKSRVGNESFVLYEGDTILLGPNDVHESEALAPCEIYRIAFNEQSVDPEIFEIARGFIGRVIRPPHAVSDIIISVFNALRGVERHDGFADKCLMQRLLECILLSFTAEAEEACKHRFVVEVDMERAVSFIKSNFAQNPSLHTVAELVHLNDNYFCTAFRDYAGINFKEFLKLQKLNHARKLLISTHKSVSEIAELSGYFSQTHFNREFKDYFGMTPLKMRRAFSGKAPKQTE